MEDTLKLLGNCEAAAPLWIKAMATTALMTIASASAAAQISTVPGATAPDAAVSAPPAGGQTLPPAADQAGVSAQSGETSGEGGDIIVTATRQSTLLSKTPVTMTVLDSKAIRDLGVTDARDLTRSVPNLAITGTGQITIRGVTSTDITEKGDPSAAFLIDGIYLARREDVQSSLFDVGRIEVLRGPQGTLYGRNTTAGVINVISARPTGEFGVSGDVSIGSYGTRVANGVVNVPLTDGIGMRAAVNYRRQNAYWRTASGQTASMYDAISGRLSLGGKALDDRLSFIVIGDVSQDKGDLPGAQSLVTTDRLYSVPLVAGEDPLRIERPTSQQQLLTLAPPTNLGKNFKSWSVRTDTTYDFGPVQLSYLGSFRKSDYTGTDFSFFAGTTYPVTFAPQNFKQVSHELRAAFGTGQPLHGQVGLYYFKEDITALITRGGSFGASFGGAPGAVAEFLRVDPTGSDSKAAFATLTYDIAPNLHLTGGIRYTKDHKVRTGTGTAVYPNAASIPVGTQNCVGLRCLRSSDKQEARFTRTTWRAGVDWDSPLGLVYASVASGYKAGGFNDGCAPGTPGAIGCVVPVSTLYYAPETLIAYEAGVKFRLGIWRVNAAAFHYNYNDLQVSQIIEIPGQQPGSFTSNAAKAKVDGIEFTAAAQLTDHDRIDVSANYLNARYLQFVPNPIQFPNFNFNGRPLSFAPKGTATLSYTHTIPIGNGGRLDLNVRPTFSAAYYITDIGGRRLYRQPGFSKSDVNVTYTAEGDRLFVGAFVRNLENNITIGNFGNGNVSIQEPRVFGARAGFRF